MRSAPAAPVILALLVALAGCEASEPPPPPPAPTFREPFHLHDYERRFGYSQAVRVGRTVYVSATMPVDSAGRLVGAGDLAAQLDAVYANLARTLAQQGGTLDNVVLERVYVTDMDGFLAVSDRRFRFHAPNDLPALALVEVERLVDPGFLVAIEAIVELPEPRPADG